MAILSVGIREAKANLSKLVKLVRRGGEVILTDRGKPVGRIVPMQAEPLPLPARIRQLEDQGLLERCKPNNPKKIPVPISLPDAPAQRLLREDREAAYGEP